LRMPWEWSTLPSLCHTKRRQTAIHRWRWEGRTVRHHDFYVPFPYLPACRDGTMRRCRGGESVMGMRRGRLLFDILIEQRYQWGRRRHIMSSS
jgi:hypothetical protein